MGLCICQILESGVVCAFHQEVARRAFNIKSAASRHKYRRDYSSCSSSKQATLLQKSCLQMCFSSMCIFCKDYRMSPFKMKYGCSLVYFTWPEAFRGSLCLY